MNLAMDNQPDQAIATESDFASEVAARREQLGVVVHDEPEQSTFEAIAQRLLSRPERPPSEQPDEPAIARRKEWDQLCLAAGQRYLGCRIENFEIRGKPEHREAQSKVVAAVGEYIRSILDRRANREGLVLYGPVGTGKDHLAFAVCHAAVRAGFTVRWLNGQDWFGQVRDAMDTDTPESRLINRVAFADFAVISDPLPPIGNLSPHQATMLYRAIDDRYIAGKPTIVTLNVNDDIEADTRIGEATWDRLCHGAWKIRCNWPSYRKPAREIA